MGENVKRQNNSPRAKYWLTHSPVVTNFYSNNGIYPFLAASQKWATGFYELGTSG